MSDKTVIDLFAGVGGMSLGFQNAGFNVVLANEIDESIAKSYIYNHPNTRMIVDNIKNLSLEGLFKDYQFKTTVIVGGPPCQGFSQKGQRKSINDERNYLFHQFVKIVDYVKPTYFLMENVPNLLSVGNGFFKKEIYDLFKGLGYSICSEILNAADYGVPQNRRRAIVLGKFNGSSPEFPIPLNNKVTIWDAISDLSFHEAAEGRDIDVYRLPAETTYQKRMKLNSVSLFNHKATGHSKLVLERLKLIPVGGGRESLPSEHLTKSIYSGTWSRMKKDDLSVTITTRFDTPSSGRFTHPYLNRAITVREAARLQSFPDKYFFIGNRSSQMKQVGNAVPPLLAEHLAKAIMKDIMKESM